MDNTLINNSLSKILQISASYKPANVYGGPIMSIATLCENVVKAGGSIEVLTTTANGKEDFDYENGDKTEIEAVPVTYFKRITGDHSHLSPSLYSYLFKNHRNFGVIHIHAWWNLVSIGAAFVCSIKGRKFILSPRGTLGEYSFSNRSGFLKKFFHRLVGRKLLQKAVFQVSSNKEADDIKKIVPEASITVIPNFIKLATHEEFKKFAEPEKFKLIFFSRIEQKKGLDFLLQALSSLQFPFVLNIFGDGEETYLQQLKQLVPEQLECNVKWNKAVYGNEKFKILADHDLLVLPSFDENFANVVIESLSVGTAASITKEVGLSDYVEENKFGWIFGQSPEEIADCLNVIATKRADLERIRHEAPVKIEEDFDTNNLTRKYIEFYSTFISSNILKKR